MRPRPRERGCARRAAIASSRTGARAARWSAGAAIAAAVAAAVVLIPGGDDGLPVDVEAGRAADPPRVPTELLANHPLSSTRGGAPPGGALHVATATTTARPSAARGGREPRPAHAVRHCMRPLPERRGAAVVVLTDARGRELLSEY